MNLSEFQEIVLHEGTHFIILGLHFSDGHVSDLLSGAPESGRPEDPQTRLFAAQGRHIHVLVIAWMSRVSFLRTNYHDRLLSSKEQKLSYDAAPYKRAVFCSYFSTNFKE